MVMTMVMIIVVMVQVLGTNVPVEQVLSQVVNDLHSIHLVEQAFHVRVQVTQRHIDIKVQHGKHLKLEL